MGILLKYILAAIYICLISTTYAPTRVIRVPLYAKQVSLDPAKMMDQSSLWVSRQINCQLMRKHRNEIQLEATKKLKYLSPTKIKFTLKDDLFFSSGAPVNSADAIASFEYVRKYRNTFRALFQWIKNLERLDKKTFIINLKQPSLQLTKFLASPNYPIFSSDFLRRSLKKPSLWKKPDGCGQYKIKKYVGGKIIILESSNIHKNNVPMIEFHLLENNQMSISDAIKYDILSMPIIGDKRKLKGYKKEFLFDPYHVNLGLNSQLPRWQNKKNRCSYFSQLDTKKIVNVYKGSARAATDFFPRGVLGFSNSSNYPNYYKNLNSKISFKQDSICLSIITASIPEKYRPAYYDTLGQGFKEIEKLKITNPKTFGETFLNQKCDGIIIGFKSNNLDGQDYLIIFSEKVANYTGYFDKNLAKKIRDTQYINDPAKRAQKYQQLSQIIKEKCLLYPILTIPMKEIYIKKYLNISNIGKSVLNEFYLGDVFEKK